MVMLRTRSAYLYVISGCGASRFVAWQGSPIRQFGTIASLKSAFPSIINWQQGDSHEPRKYAL
jgi:hypothetical protein